MTFVSNGPGEMSLGTADRAAAVAEVKRLLAVAIADDDALIAAFSETALGLAERFIGRVLIVRAVTERIAAGRGWRALGAAPVAVIDDIGLVAGSAVSPLPITDYAIDIDADAIGWVRTIGATGVAEIGYHAGSAASWGAIPMPLRQGVVLLAAYLYTQRDASDPPPAAVTVLWRPYRDMALARAVRT